MKVRSALLLGMTATLAMAGAPAPQRGAGPIPPALPNSIVDNNVVPSRVLYPQKPIYKSFNGTPFGDPCRICPDDIAQGALNDCSLLSAFGAVAIASPGTIQRAIADTGMQEQGDEVYLIRYYTNGQSNGYPVASSFPAQNTSGLDDWATNIKSFNWGSPRTPLFLFAHPPAYTGSYLSRFTQSSNPFSSFLSKAAGGLTGTTWPMLMEKGYAVKLGNSYMSMDPGIDAKVALETVTGQKAHIYDVNAALKPHTQLDAVSIKDSPAVADVGGHSIIGGLLRGDLKAIQPNLKMCVTQEVEKHETCTPICRESHTCDQPFLSSIELGAGQKLRIKLLDVDRPGSEHVLALFDQNDPAHCTQKNPCTYDVPAGQWVLAGPLVFAFTTRQASSSPLVYLDATLNELQQTHQAVIVGTPPKCVSIASPTIAPYPCDQMFQPSGPLVRDHAYYLKGYERQPAGPVSNNVVVIGDPHGSEQRVSLNDFFHTFSEIIAVQPARVPTPCGCN